MNIEEMHKWTSLSWQQSRKEAFLQVQDMKEQLNFLSEEEAHKLMVEQTQRINKGGQLSRGRRFNKI